MSIKEEEFDYQKLLKEAIEEHFLSSLEDDSSSRERLIRAFVAKMFEFSNSNVLATSLHAFRMFFAVLGISDAEDLALDIINKEKLLFSSKDNLVFDSCAYSEDEIQSIVKNNKRE